MKNKSRNYFKKTINKFDKIDNTLSDSNNINENQGTQNNNEFNYNINSGEICSSNELSFLIFSSNKDTNKYKRNILFGNLLSMSKQKDKISFNSLVKDSFKNSNININLDNNIINGNHTNFFLTSDKNKIENNKFKINQLSSLKNSNFNTTIKRDYNNLFDNENNFNLNLNDYLEKDDNFENHISNDNSQKEKENISHSHQNLDLQKNTRDINKNEREHIFKIDKVKDNKLEIIIEERKKEKETNNKILLNDGLFNTNIKDKISKIKEDIIKKNIKHKNEIGKSNIINNKFINTKLKKDKFTDYYELMYKELEQRDESKELENIFSEFFTEIKYKFLKKNFYNDFIYSLNNCKLYELIKINNSNCFDTLISNMELSNNKNLSNSNSYFNNSKSELLRDGSQSHSFNDSHSSQIIENNVEKNVPIISKFPKLILPQSIIPEESSNFLYSNNDYILNRSFGDPIEENNINNSILEIQEIEDEKNIIFEQNIKKELDKIENNGEINIYTILDDLKLNHKLYEEKQINEENDIKEYKSKIFYNILIISQNNNINIIQKSPFSKIIKMN